MSRRSFSFRVVSMRSFSFSARNFGRQRYLVESRRDSVVVMFIGMASD